ncbi:MAG TPA: ribonuclease HIII [Candidatus Cloacimonadota bacterium]|nr:ribonuclease HIII [Candidatus Cloacimonadota bacterium]HPT72445.1 ribonuclease HIII [Candidatus Cloacimonadota bacterium]
MNQIMLAHIADLLKKAEAQNLMITDEKEIPYGMQLVFEKEGQSIPMNVYHSEKKGISFVIGGNKSNPLRPLAEQLIHHQIIQIDKSLPKHHDWKQWIGSDESGKGDFFGPLVICAFYCRNDMVDNLQKWGTRDSKLMKDSDIIKTAKLILKTYNSHAKVMILKPDKYNNLYSDFVKQGKKLNEMMTWMHGKAVTELLDQYPCDGILIDQFQKSNQLTVQIRKTHKVVIMERTQAESDIAVAAASIIARYHFLETMASLSRKYGIALPKGASHNVISIAREFAAQFGKERLNEVAKIHFITYQKV